MPNYTTPGVYIEEQPAIGPIGGVGTSTAAFIGPAQDGPIGVPIRVTNRTQFTDVFGSYLTAPRFYLANAVEAFFLNGGTNAFIVRVGTAVRASRNLDDQGGAGGFSLRVEALEEGPGANGISIRALADSIVNTTIARVQGPVASSAATMVTMQNAADAANLRPSDVVSIAGVSGTYTIDRIRGADVYLTTVLAGAPVAGALLRIADLAASTRSFRVTNSANIEVGSSLTLTQAGGPPALNVVVDAIAADFVRLASPLGTILSLASTASAVAITGNEFELRVTPPVGTVERFRSLSMDPRHSRYFGRVIDSEYVSVRLADPASVQSPPLNRPAFVTTTLAGGTADDLSALTSTHYLNGIDALVNVPEVNLLCIPDRYDVTVQQAMIAHCETMGDRFAILDPPPNSQPSGAGSIEDHRAFLESARGFGAIYYPRILVTDRQAPSGPLLKLPPSGHLAGLYARTDNERGVHKAPANVMIDGAIALERTLNETEMGNLNILGINCLRTFPNRARPTVWGARTTAPAAEAPWRYVPVRRLMLYIEESIQEGIRWAVFEPNNLELWKKLIRTISEFLTRVWRAGALFGAKAEHAFYVKCDEELNPEPVRALGRVIVEIGVAPVRPAEFVIIRIGQWAGGSEVDES